MLFNSFGFILLYLPITVAFFFWLGHRKQLWAGCWLALASLFFYAQWDYRYIYLLLSSVGFNYWAGLRIDQSAAPYRKRWLTFAVTADLILLGYYKYANFFVDTINSTGLTSFTLPGIVLPIGISFFTFTQIAYLVDTYYGKVTEKHFINYVLFVTYFPHLIAGPVLHHKEMMPQFADAKNYRPRWQHLTIGLSIFVVGLAKKILIADNIAPLASPVFAVNAHPQLIEAWIGALAYAFQLYFDFSGYSDMAIGLSRLFGVKLPLNFDSPYKAVNISEFWRRWHMTLSRFLRDYLYIPLGGNRGGVINRYRNLLITMLLGGLWHGAGWTFVIWGGLHGMYLVINHAWQFITRNVRGDAGMISMMMSRAVTFFAVLIAWVFFRAPDLHTAFDVLGAMAGRNGLSLPQRAEVYAGWFARLPFDTVFNGIRWIDFGSIGVPMLAVAMLIAWCAPNTQEIFRRYEPCLETVKANSSLINLSWSPTKTYSAIVSVLFALCVLNMNRIAEFLYFQF